MTMTGTSPVMEQGRITIRIIIGEAVKRVSDGTRAREVRVPWKQISGCEID